MIEVESKIHLKCSNDLSFISTYVDCFEVFNHSKKNASIAIGDSKKEITFWSLENGEIIGKISILEEDSKSLESWNISFIKDIPVLRCLVAEYGKNLNVIHYDQSDDENFRIEKNILKTNNVYMWFRGTCVYGDIVVYCKNEKDDIVFYNLRERKIIKTMEFDDFSGEANQIELYSDEYRFPGVVILRLQRIYKIIDIESYEILYKIDIDLPIFVFDHKRKFSAFFGRGDVFLRTASFNGGETETIDIPGELFRKDTEVYSYGRDFIPEYFYGGSDCMIGEDNLNGKLLLLLFTKKKWIILQSYRYGSGSSNFFNVKERGKYFYFLVTNRNEGSMSVTRVINRKVKEVQTEDIEDLRERIEYLREMEFCHGQDQVLTLCLDSFTCKVFKLFF